MNGTRSNTTISPKSRSNHLRKSVVKRTEGNVSKPTSRFLWRILSYKVTDTVQNTKQYFNVLQINSSVCDGRARDALMSGEISVSSTEVLKSSMKLSMRVYVSECIKTCRSEGDTICFVGITNPSAVILSRKGVR